MKTLLLLFLTLPLFAQFERCEVNEHRAEVLSSINNKRVSVFINEHWNGAYELWVTDSIPMGFSLTQWGLESGWGTASLAKERNNYGGIRHKYEGRMRLKPFTDKQAFYKAYAKIFKRECYKRLKLRSIDNWIKAVSYRGCYYASSKEYEAKLKSIIKMYGLNKIE